MGSGLARVSFCAWRQTGSAGLKRGQQAVEITQMLLHKAMYDHDFMNSVQIKRAQKRAAKAAHAVANWQFQ